MQDRTLVAVYRSREEAERVRDELYALGVPEGDIRLSGDDVHIGQAREDSPNPLAPKREEGIFDWLFGSDVPETDRRWYGANLSDGQTALSVRAPSAAHGERLLDTMEAHDPIDIEDDSEPAIGAAQDYAVTGSGTATAARARTEDETGRLLDAERETTAREAPAEEAIAGDEVIPVVKEELSVGKRQSETRHRIRAYVVERPVEEQVNLHDERVTIERRPVSGDRTAAPGDITEREFEVIERHEEPVVAKKARAVEEVVVHKDARDRTERVRDKVRETRVEIDRAAAGNKPGMSREAADDRSLGERIADGAHELKENVTPDRKR